MPNYADFNMATYFTGLDGTKPPFPVSYAGWEEKARAGLDPELFDYVAGGAGDESTQRANADAFARWSIYPRMLRGAAQRDLSIEILGRTYPTPLLMAPIGVAGVMHESRHGDLEVAKAAAATGVPMIASTFSQDPMEALAASWGETGAWFQLYTPSDRALAESLAKRAEAAGFSALVVTLDTWSLGWRPRDLLNASMPMLKGGQLLANYFSDPVFLNRLSRPPEEDPMAATLAWVDIFGNPGLTWDDLPWLQSLTNLPLVLKGICHPDDVRKARDAGVAAIYCSTHGGRQAISGAALDFLPDVVAAANGVPVIFDSGVRTGADVFKAMALGADAVAVGRPYGYGLTMGGASGVEHVLRCLLAETDLTMGLNGHGRISDIASGSLLRSGPHA